MSQKTFKCKYCNAIFKESDKYAAHMEKKHNDMIPPDMTPAQYIYFLKTGKKNGNCVICKNPTKWNEKTNKYRRFCENPEYKKQYADEFKNRMKNKYGKTTLLNDPEHQRAMLANRHISGVYTWSDYKHKFRYTGSYEKAFLEFLDRLVDFDPEDIISPSPHNYTYTYDGRDHYYFPDVYIPSLNLEIEIKDGGDNPNMHHKIQEVDKVKEHLKDEVLSSKSVPVNYLKITNKNHMKFFEYLEEAKKRFQENNYKKIVMI